MVGEFVTRIVRATVGTDPRRIRVTRAPRPEFTKGPSMKIAVFGLAWLVAALLVAVPFGFAMRSTPKPDRLRGERQEETETEECGEVVEVAS